MVHAGTPRVLCARDAALREVLPRHKVRVGLAECRHEPFFAAWLEVEDVWGDEVRAVLTGRADDGFEVRLVVRDAGDYRGDHDPAGDPGIGQLAEGLEALDRLSCARLHLLPDD